MGESKAGIRLCALLGVEKRPGKEDDSGISKVCKPRCTRTRQRLLKAEISLLEAWDMTDYPSWPAQLRLHDHITLWGNFRSDLLQTPFFKSTIPPFSHKSIWRMHQWPTLWLDSVVSLGRLIPMRCEYRCWLVETVDYWGWANTITMGCELRPNFPKREWQVNGRQSGFMAFIAKTLDNFYPVNYHDPHFAIFLIFLYFASSITST